jgi:hypothetical protein
MGFGIGDSDIIYNCKGWEYSWGILLEYPLIRRVYYYFGFYSFLIYKYN